MKPKSTLRSFLAIAGSSLLAISYTQAATLYWDGTTSTDNADGGAGAWNGTDLWDTLALAGTPTTWNSSTPDFAVFGGTLGAVTTGAPITTSGIQFNTTGYTITASPTNTLSFSGTSNIIFNNIAAASISGTIANTAANVILSTTVPATGTASILTLGGTTTAGWSGATTINAGITMRLDTANQVLVSTSGITLNGGNILTSNTNNTQGGFDRINNAAGITSNGGTFTYQNSSVNPAVYAETIGSVALTTGQLNLVLNTSMAAGTQAQNNQTLTLGGLTQAGTSAITLSALTTGPQAAVNRNMIVVSGSGTTSGWVDAATSNSIHGPWATVGTTAALQTDYAVFNGGYAVGANTAASVESAWTDSTKQYTLANATGSAVNGKLTGTRNINSLRNTTAAGGAITVNTTSDFVTLAGNTFADGDVVVLSATAGGLTAGVPYYVRDYNGDTLNGFKLAATSGGTAINITALNTSTITGGITLSTDNNLGTLGILNGSTAVLAIGASGTGAVTLPSAVSGNLFVTPGAGNIAINAPVTDNGAGVLALVKSGSGTLTLTGNNTYTGSTTVNGGTLTMTGSNAYSGGTVINNAGTLTVSGDTALGEVNGGITFNGNGSLVVSAATTLASTRTLTLNNGAIPYLGDTNINGAAPYLIINGKITGTGGIQASHYALGGSATVASTRLASTANDFTGPVILGGNTNATYSAFVLETASLADSAGAGNIIFSNGRNTAADSAIFQWGAGAVTGLTLNHRQLEIATTTGTANVISGVSNINANAANTVVINTDLKVSTTSARTFQLGGTNTGANTFAGDIANGVGAIGLTKDGGGTWVLSGNNTYTGATTLIGGTLSVGTTSNLGAPAANLVFNGTSVTAGGTLQITGTALTSFSTIGHTVSFTAARLVGLDIANAAHTFTADQVLNQTTGGFTKIGAGTVVLNQANTYSGITTAGGGLLKLDHATALPGGTAAIGGTSNLTIDGGGIVGLTANSGDFNRGIGTLGTQVRWTGSGGFAAFGGTRTVLFSASSINWTATNFIGDTRTLVLGSSAADGTVDWQQPISMAGGIRTVQVNNGSAAVDAIMSGRIAGGVSGNTNNGLTKTGAGTLALTNNTNSYWGPTTVSEGTLRLGASNVLPDTNTNVTIAAATLDVGAGFTDLTGTGTLDVTAAATINLGDGSSQLAFANSFGVDWTGGSLNITGTFVSGFSLKFGDGSPGTGLNSGQLAAITINGVPGSYTINGSGFLVSGGGPVGFAAWQAANGTLGDRSADHDNDGVDNGTEHFIHGTVANSGFTALPGVDKALDGTLSVTWTKAATYTGSYPTHYVVETSTTLAGPWTIETSPGNVSFPSANEVKYTFPGGPGYSGKNFARLKVTGP